MTNPWLARDWEQFKNPKPETPITSWLTEEGLDFLLGALVAYNGRIFMQRAINALEQFRQERKATDAHRANLKKGMTVTKLWLSVKRESDKTLLTTKHVLACDPYLSFCGEYMVQFEGSCCAYLASLCFPNK